MTSRRGKSKIMKRFYCLVEKGNPARLLDTRQSENVYFVIRHADFAILAQLIEHSIRNRKVVGLNPMDGSIIFYNLRAL